MYHKLCDKCGCVNKDYPLIINGVEVCNNCKTPLPEKEKSEIARINYSTVGVK